MYIYIYILYIYIYIYRSMYCFCSRSFFRFKVLICRVYRGLTFRLGLCCNTTEE